MLCLTALTIQSGTVFLLSMDETVRVPEISTAVVHTIHGTGMPGSGSVQKKRAALSPSNRLISTSHLERLRRSFTSTLNFGVSTSDCPPRPDTGIRTPSRSLAYFRSASFHMIHLRHEK